MILDVYYNFNNVFRKNFFLPNTVPLCDLHKSADYIVCIFLRIFALFILCRVMLCKANICFVTHTSAWNYEQWAHQNVLRATKLWNGRWNHGWIFTK